MPRRMSFSKTHGEGRCVPNERHPRVKRLARLLRNRDEEEGHR